MKMTMKFLRRHSWCFLAVCLFKVLLLLIFLNHHRFSWTVETMSNLNEESRTVFLLETSRKGTLNLRQLAAVESAARFLKYYKVKVLIFTKKSIVISPPMEDLTDAYNVQFLRVSMFNISTGTPLENWYRKGKWKVSPYAVAHLSDAFRFLLVWLYGGVYLDLDVLFLRQWSFEKDTLCWEEESVLASSVFAFHRNHPFLLDCLNELSSHYDPFVWGANGPLLLTRVLKRYTQPGNQDIVILKKHGFSEIHYTEGRKFFEPKNLEEVLNRTATSIGAHVWNKITSEFKVNYTSDCAYMHFVKQSAPVVYRHIVKQGNV